MNTLNELMVKQSAKKLKLAIHKFCRNKSILGLCNTDECENCYINKAYEIAEKYDDEDK